MKSRQQRRHLDERRNLLSAQPGIWQIHLMSWLHFPLARWNRLSFALGFLLLELVAFSAKAPIGATRFVWITIVTLLVFTLFYWLEDSLVKHGSKTSLVLVKILFGLCFACAVLWLLVKMIST
jgi:hypothetical protein